MRYECDGGFYNCEEESTTDLKPYKKSEPRSNTRYRPTNLSTFSPCAELVTKTLLRGTSLTPTITPTRYGSVSGPTFTYALLSQTFVTQPKLLQSAVQRLEGDTIVHTGLGEYFDSLKIRQAGCEFRLGLSKMRSVIGSQSWKLMNWSMRIKSWYSKRKRTRKGRYC
jgi:hypothetical protein